MTGLDKKTSADALKLVIFIVVMAFWFIRLQERLDVVRSEREGLG